MGNKNSLLGVVLILIVALAALFVFSSFKNMKKMELDFNEKKALLVKEGLDLRDRIEVLKGTLTQKTEEAIGFEKEKRSLEEKLLAVKKESDSLIETYGRDIKVLQLKNTDLKKTITALESSPIINRLRDALSSEENDQVRKVLSSALDKLELIRAGKPVDLEPIVVNKDLEDSTSVSDEGEVKVIEKTGSVVSVDAKNNLMVISLGTKDEIRQGERCAVIKDDQEIARAEIMSVRYRIAAAFIDDIKYNHTIEEIKQGDRVLIVTK